MRGHTLTTRAVATLRDIARRGTTRGRRLVGRPTHISVGVSGVRWWKVVGSTSVGTNKFGYTLQDIDNPDIEVDGRNKMEHANTASVAGPSYDLTTLPGTYTLLPIGKTYGGADVECIVPAWQEDDGDGNVQWWFCCENLVDGECDGGGGGGDALTSDGLDQFAATTSAEFASVISDPTGSGAVVLATSPTLTTPTIGVATATSVNKVAITAPATGATITVADGVTLTASASATINGGTHSGTNTGDQVVTGRLLGVYVHTSGTTHTTAAGCTKVRVRCVGAGGGGGGVANTASRSGAAGGGGAGGQVEKVYTVTPSTGYTYAVGTAGTGGTAGANNGNAGGDSTFTDGVTLITAKGGNGGKGCTAATGVIGQGADQTAISTNGDWNGAGMAGGYGVAPTGAVAISGTGGSATPHGAGANGRVTQGTGGTATGLGSGGAGGCCISGGGSAAGGDGTGGCVIVEEFS